LRQKSFTILSFFIFTLFFLAGKEKSFAQNKKIDSLKKVLANSKEDSDKVEILLRLSNQYQATRDIGSTINYAKESLKLAQKINFKKGETRAYFRLGFIYTQINKLAEAKQNLNESIRISEETGDNEVGNRYMALARIYVIENNFPESMKLLLKALKLYENIGNKNRTALVYWRLTWIYMGYGNYQEALRYCSLSNDLCMELDLKQQIAGNLCLMSQLNIELGNDSMANVHINSVSKLAKENNFQEGFDIANFYQSILLVSQAEDSLLAENNNAVKEKLILAEKYSLKALDYFKSREGAIDQWDVFPLVTVYNVLGRVNIGLRNFSKAKLYLEKGNQLALKIKNQPEILKSYQNLWRLDSMQGNYREAIDNYKQYTLYRDSITNNANTLKMETAVIQYAFDKKEDSLKQQQVITEIKLETQKKQKYFYWVGLGLLGLLSFFINKNFLNQKKINKLADETHAREKAELELHSLRAQLNPHFMFNSLNAIQELILMEENEKSHSYLARFAKLLRMLLENAEKPFIPLQREIDFLKLYLSLENLRVPDLKHTINIDPTIDTENIVIPNMILQPYIENAIWHGLSHKKGDKMLLINITRNNGVVDYEIKDNGVGRKKSAELKSLFRKEHKSKGMELLSRRFKLLAKEYGSDIETKISDVISNDEIAGTMVKIEVPMKFSSDIKTG